MKKLILVLPLALALGGCPSMSESLNAVQLATIGVTNPVTKQDLYNFENTMIVAFAALNGYKKACIRGVVDTNCRANVAAMQTYTQQMPGLLATTRNFVKNNDQVNAASAFSTLQTLYGQFKTLALANNVKVQ